MPGRIKLVVDSLKDPIIAKIIPRSSTRREIALAQSRRITTTEVCCLKETLSSMLSKFSKLKSFDFIVFEILCDLNSSITFREQTLRAYILNGKLHIKLTKNKTFTL